MKPDSRQKIAENIRQYRSAENLEFAVREADRGIAGYPESNFFYKIKGDLLVEQGEYLKAAESYLLFLERLTNHPEYFKNFIKFWDKFSKNATEDEKEDIYNKLISNFNQQKYSFAIMNGLIQFFYKWKFRRLLRDILAGDNHAVWQVSVLPLDKEVLMEAERFIEYAMKYKFGSLDAVIASTARKNSLKIVTHDKGFRAALKSAELPIEISNA